MKNEPARFKIVLFPAFAAICLLFTSGIFVFAQRPIYPIDRRVEQINRQNREFEREEMNRDMKGDRKKGAEEIKRAQAIKAQIRKDLESLQSEYNKIVMNLQASGGQPEFKFVNETAATVKKNALRLKDNLAFPKPEPEPPSEKDQKGNKSEKNFANIRQSLLTLCKHIFNFVTNPIFETPTGLNIEQATQARRELDVIIQLSETIGEHAVSRNKPD